MSLASSLSNKACATVDNIVKEYETWPPNRVARHFYQLIANWNSFPEYRQTMLQGALSDRNTVFQNAALASVLRALCDRDGY